MIRIFSVHAVVDRVGQLKAGFAVDEEDLLHPVDQGVQQHHLAERFAGAQGLEAPAQPFPGERHLQRFAQPFQHGAEGFGNGAPDGRPHEREQHAGEIQGIFAQGGLQDVFDGGLKGLGQAVVLARPYENGFGDNLAHLAGVDVRVVQALFQALQQGDFTLEQKPAQGFQVGIPVRRFPSGVARGIRGQGMRGPAGFSSGRRHCLRFPPCRRSERSPTQGSIGR